MTSFSLQVNGRKRLKLINLYDHELSELNECVCYLLVIHNIEAILNAFVYVLFKAFYQFTQDLVGQVFLSLKFLPTSQRLEIGVLKVRAALTRTCSDAGTNETFHEKYMLDVLNVKHVTGYMANFLLCCVFFSPVSQSQCAVQSAQIKISKNFHSDPEPHDCVQQCSPVFSARISTTGV